MKVNLKQLLMLVVQLLTRKSGSIALCIFVVIGGGLSSMCSEPPPFFSEQPLPEPRDVNTGSNTKVSLNPFPYDLTSKALQKVAQLSKQNGNLCTVQIDNGIPWQQALDGSPYPGDVMEEWQRLRSNAGASQSIYLAIAPLKDDRETWAGAHGGKKEPGWVRSASGSDAKLIQAYTNHVLKAIDYFKPNYLNIGVEAGDLAQKNPGKWKHFETFYQQTRNSVKKRHPNLLVGMSWGLPVLMQNGVLERSSSVISSSDYVGISFYPYMGDFYAKIGGVRIPQQVPAQWQEPLKWLRIKVKDKFKKPIAICETAYSSDPVQAKQWNLNMHVEEDYQAFYVKDLAAIAKRDDYLFVMYFLSVDYTPLKNKLGIPLMAFWENTGFFDHDLTPKPAWYAYQKAWLGRATSSPEVPQVRQNMMNRHSAGMTVPITKSSELFASGGQTNVVAPDGMKWTYKYSKKEWAWALRELPQGRYAGARSLKFDIRSSAPVELLLQLEESSGEALFHPVKSNPAWTTVSVPLAKFQPDPSKKKNGIVESAKLKSMMFADGAGAEKGKAGTRTVEIRKLRFEK